MTTLGYVAVGAALSQVLLTGVLLATSGLSGLVRRLYGVLLVGAAAYLAAPLASGHIDLLPLFALSTLVPGIFWLFSQSLFDDHYDFPLWQPTLVVLMVSLPTAHSLAGRKGWEWPDVVFVQIPQFAEFVVLILAMLAVFRHWRDDLVNSRRRLRIWFCGSTGLLIFSLILAREVLFVGAPWLENGQYVVTAVMLLGTNTMLLRFSPGLLNPVRRKAEAEPSEDIETVEDLDAVRRQLEPIDQLVMEQGLFREHGMTIAKLADAVGLPEYRLRRLINSGLGYRNFNDFLNSFRIRDAATRLADAEEAEIPVLSIALDAGFRSISSFNKVFKETHGVTPTEFRRRKLSQESAVA